MRLSAILLSSSCLAPSIAAAAPSPGSPPTARRTQDGIHQGGFIYGSPAIIAIPLEDDDEPFRGLDPTWQWSFGGGYLFAPGPIFKATVGGAFEHMIYNFDSDFVDGSQLRLLAESRLGGGNNKVWGYGLVGLGLVLSIVDVDTPVGGADDTDAGFGLQLGGGIQGAVWRSLFLGGEIDFDLAFMHSDEACANCDDDYNIYTMGIKLVIGWYF